MTRPLGRHGALIAVALLPLALAAGCASGPAAAPENDARTTPYGLFLAGQAAINKGQGALAAQLLGKASAEVEGNPLLRSEAFTAALLAGDVRQAAAIAPLGEKDDPSVRPLALLTSGVEAMAEGRGREAQKIFADPAAAPARDPAAALMAPFAAALAGDRAAAVARPLFSGDPVDQFQADLDQGLMFERLGRAGEAETAFRALIARGDPGGEGSLALGALMERQHRQAEAIALYDEALRRDPKDALVQEARARAAAHRPAPAAPGLREAAAKALLAPAANLIVHRQEEGALACLRLALRLDPGENEAWLMVGDIMSAAGDTDAARAAYAQPKPHTPQYSAAQAKLAWSWQNAGDKVRALAIAKAAAAADPASRDAKLNLADLERADGDDAGSIAILDELLADPGGGDDWRLYYMRAAAYQEQDRWPEAEKDLEAALKIAPNEPELLNFLGYSWIDRGERLQQGLAMVQRAVDQDPQSGAMLDSLGWAYYRLGDYKAAVEKLENAAALDASDPEVNDHLGDAYWKVGRKTEAIYQWRQVLTLQPNAKLRAQVEAKLTSGPDDRATPADLTGS